MAAVATSPRTVEHPEVTRWVLVVSGDADVQRRTCRILVRAGFAVDAAFDVPEALRCLGVISPALVVVDEDLPGAGDLLDRARAVVVDSASHGDVVGQELADHRERNRGELFR